MIASASYYYLCDRQADGVGSVGATCAEAPHARSVQARRLNLGRHCLLGVQIGVLVEHPQHPDVTELL
jgi:hypothetical protein